MMPAGTVRPDWIAVDWGTTRLRAWALSKSGDALAASQSDNGMSVLTRAEFEPALIDLVEPWLPDGPITVLACGMVGSRQGWVEAPYAATPCPPLTVPFAVPRTIDPRLDVRVVPGVKQIAPPDVMRGEETQIAGLLHLDPDYDGILCLPGTHTKWVRISEGQVSAFRTAMTGDIFACLRQHSVLRHSVGNDGWDDDAFCTALGDAISRPEHMAVSLFSIRADGLLNAVAPEAGMARLSGTLIGIELAATRGYWLGQKVTLIGASGLAGIYAKALALQGVECALSDADEVTRAGLFAAYECLRNSRS